jgi:hypothetical protein
MKKLNDVTYIFIRSRESYESICECLSLALQIKSDEITNLTIRYIAKNIVGAQMDLDDYDGLAHLTWKYFRRKSEYKIFKVEKILKTDKNLIKCFKRKYSGIIDISNARSVLEQCNLNNEYKIRDLKKNF